MSLNFHVIQVTPFAQNSSVLWCEASRCAAVVDPGGDVELIVDWVMRQHLTVDKLLLTHGHIDHAGGATLLSGQLGVPIEGPHRADSFWLEQLPQQSSMFGFPRSEALTPDRWLEEGDIVSVGEELLNVIHCPGHTPGHVVFHSHAAGLLIVGDVLFKGSIGRTDFPMSNRQQLIDAIQYKLFALPDDTAVLPGHGSLTTIGEEKRLNPYLAKHCYR